MDQPVEPGRGLLQRGAEVGGLAEVGLDHPEAGLQRRHQQRRPDPLADHVGDGHQEPAAQVRGVVGVAGDVVAGPPPGGDVEAGQRGERRRQQPGLDLAGQPDLLAQPLAVDALLHPVRRLQRPDGERGQGRREVGRVGVRHPVEPGEGGSPEQHGPARHIARPQRDDPAPPLAEQAGVGQSGRCRQGAQLARHLGGLPASCQDQVERAAVGVGVAQGHGHTAHQELAHESVGQPAHDGLAVERAAERLGQLEQRPQGVGAGGQRAVGLAERVGRAPGGQRRRRGTRQRPRQTDLGRRERLAAQLGPERHHPHRVVGVAERQDERQARLGERLRWVGGVQAVTGRETRAALDDLDPPPVPVGQHAHGAGREQAAHQREHERAERVGEGERGVGRVVDGAERGGGSHAPSYPACGPSFSRWMTSAWLISPSSTVSRTHVLTWWNPCRPAAPGLR